MPLSTSPIHGLIGRFATRAHPRRAGAEKRPRVARLPRYELHELFEYGDTVVAALSFYARSRGSENEIVQEETDRFGSCPPDILSA
jgi:hypothetical protein